MKLCACSENEIDKKKMKQQRKNQLERNAHVKIAVDTDEKKIVQEDICLSVAQ